MAINFDRTTWFVCSHCKGKGVVKGMFENNPSCSCVYCNAIGWIMPDGNPVPEHDALKMLREQLNVRVMQVNLLKLEVESFSVKTRKETALDEFYSKPGYKGD